MIVGDYWLDPNGGLREDAIKVHCDFTKEKEVETCVEATSVFDTYKMDEFKKIDMNHKWLAKTVSEDEKRVSENSIIIRKRVSRIDTTFFL